MQLIIQAENAEDLRFQVVTLAEEFTKGSLMATLQSKQATAALKPVAAPVTSTAQADTRLAPETDPNTDSETDDDSETEVDEVQHVNGEHKPKAKAKKEKKSKAKNAEPEVLYEALDVEVAPEVIERVVPAKREVTKQEVIEALQKVNSMKGLPKAREVLGQFNCARLSDVKEAIYPQFLKACNQALA